MKILLICGMIKKLELSFSITVIQTSGGIHIKQKKISIMSLCLIFVLLMSGCLSTPPGTSTEGNTVPEEVTPTPAPQALHIALCTSPGAIDDTSRNADCFEGALSFLLSRGEIDSLTPLQEATGDPETALRTFRELAPSFDVMIFVGPTFSQISSIALENPSKYFILVDAPLTDASGAEVQVKNVCSIQFPDQECGFFAGVAAALETHTNRVAIINDVVSPANTRYYYGFRSGVAYANGNYGTAAEVIDHPAYAGTLADGSFQEGNFIGRATDLNTGYVLARSLMAEGCDILFTAAGFASSGVYTAVREGGTARVIGSETDQYSQGALDDGTNFILTSVTKAFAVNVEAQLNAIANGSFQSGNTVLSASENATGYVSEPGHQQLSDRTIQALSDIYPLMQDGTIIPLSHKPEA